MIIKVSNYYISKDLTLSSSPIIDNFFPDNIIFETGNNVSFFIMNNEYKYLSIGNKKGFYYDIVLSKRNKVLFKYKDNKLLCYDLYLSVLNNNIVLSSDLSCNTETSIEFNILDRDILGQGGYGIIYKRIPCENEDVVSPSEVSKLFKFGRKDAYLAYEIIDYFNEEANKYMILPKKICKIKFPENINFGSLSDYQVIYDLANNDILYVSKSNMLIGDIYRIFFPFRNIIKGCLFLTDNGYVNADIRLPNICQDLHSGEYKMIDMDLLKWNNIEGDIFSFQLHPFTVFFLSVNVNSKHVFKVFNKYKEKYIQENIKNEYLEVFKYLNGIDTEIYNMVINEITFNDLNYHKYKDFYKLNNEKEHKIMKLNLYCFSIFTLCTLVYNINLKFSREEKNEFINFIKACVVHNKVYDKEKILNLYDKFLSILPKKSKY